MLRKTLTNVRQLAGPQLLHVVTRKGQGYPKAEADPILYHGVTRFDQEIGIVAKPPGKPTYTQVFGDWICDMASRDPRLVGITPAMREGSGLVRFSQEHAGRYFDVGIAEQHAVTFAAGLACEGLKPVVAIYSTFLQRAYDQLIHDVALQNLPVMFAIDRAGLVGADGPTHAGSFDFCYLRCLPNMTVMAPADEGECRNMLYTAYTLDTPSAVRYPRGAGPGVAVDREMRALPIGKGELRREAGRRTQRIALLAFGSMLGPALAVAEQIDATVANMRFVKPLDVELCVRAGAHPRKPGDGRGKRRRRRRRQRRRRSARRARHRGAAVATRAARSPSSIRATPHRSSRTAASTRRASLHRSRPASASRPAKARTLTLRSRRSSGLL